MKQVARILAAVVAFGVVLEGVGVLFEDESFSVSAALGTGLLFTSLMLLVWRTDEHIEHPLIRFGVLAAGFVVLLEVITPLLRGDEVDPFPAVLVLLGIAALVTALGHLERGGSASGRSRPQGEGSAKKSAAGR